ncbi:MAG: L-histidine N(alpha)-methyltransferase [Chromatiales bacterium]
MQHHRRKVSVSPQRDSVPATIRAGIAFYDHQPRPFDFMRDVLHGLSRPRKALPPKYFYDQRGSALFEQICELEEYYLTRTEISLLEEHAGDIAALLGHDCVLFEYGSGNSRKVSYLLEALEGDPGYVAIDISRGHLFKSAATLARLYPHVRVAAVCADFTQPFPLPEIGRSSGRRVGFFPGSSIGNFSPRESIRFLRSIARMLGKNGVLLIGVDLKKDRGLLEAAYNDLRGVTAAFNLNLLLRINRELGADFQLDCFRHHAFYNEARGRVEMHLASTDAQTAIIGDSCIGFARGETIHTENSYKYSIAEFQRLAGRCGFEPIRVWADERELFSLHALAVSADATVAGNWGSSE